MEAITADGKLVLVEYNFKKAETTAFKNLVIWPALSSKKDPLENPNIFFDRPDLELIFLERGLAKLINEAQGTPEHRNAQASAKAARKGWWEELNPKPPPQPVPPAKKLEWLPLVGLWGGIGTLLGSLAWLFTAAIRYFRKRKVPILFLGTGGVGKTWIWIKMVNPDTILDDKVAASDAVREKKAEIPENFGKYILTPIYIDTPGRMAGEQARQLFKRKRIWLIVLSSTADNTVSFSSNESQKIDREYVAKQLGYLTLPLGLLAAKKIPKPTLVVIVFAKFDLFSSSTPEKPESASAKALLSLVFKDHKTAIERECKSAKIAVITEFCSAKEGWRTEGLMRQIKRSIFS